MKVRLFAAALWLLFVGCGLLIIEDEKRYTPKALLIQSGGAFCDVPIVPPDYRPRGPREPVVPFTADQRSVA